MAVDTPWNKAEGGGDNYLIQEAAGTDYITRESYLFFGRILLEASGDPWTSVADTPNVWTEEPAPPAPWQPV